MQIITNPQDFKSKALLASLVARRINNEEITIEYLYSVASKRSRTVFLSWLLIDPEDGCIKYANTDQTRQAIKDVADLLSKSLTEKISDAQWKKVKAAANAANAAANAANAANAAYAAYAAYAAAYAANAAYAAYAANAAANAANAANAAAYAANAANAAYAAAKKRQIEKFLEILKEQQ